MRFVRSYFLLLLMLLPVLNGLGKVLAATGINSVLSTGKWTKISVAQSGIYKLDYSDIVRMGIDPDKVQLYGYGGKMLSEDFRLNDYVDDLPIVPVYKALGADGRFNAGDYILFYAQGPISWSYDALYAMYRRNRNPYSDKAYYFVGEREGGTLTTTTLAYNGTANRVVKTFTDFVLHESETVNMGETVAGSGTGRELYGEDFLSINSKTFTFQTEDPDSTSVSKILAEMVVNSTSITYGSLYVNNQFLDFTSFFSIQALDDYHYGSQSGLYGTFATKTNTTQVRLEYQPSAITAKSRAFLDHITLNIRRNLRMSSNPLVFRDPQSVGFGSIARFQISTNRDSLLVFDVSQPGNPIRMKGATSDGLYSFVNTASVLREYVAVDVLGSIPKPTVEGVVSSQNLHAQSGMDMVILCPSEFLPQAIRLAEIHAEYDNMQTLIVTPEQVYNEFSSGTPDATAVRRMMKWYKDHPNQAGKKPAHLLLFGDGIYDNRWVTSALSKRSVKLNKILTYQSKESLDGYTSLVTDDYFGFLDNDEGLSLGSAKLDIGIGRFPVSTIEEATVAVNKTIAYLKNARKGAWKNRLLFLADNGDARKGDLYLHEKQANEITETLNTSHPEFMVRKIFLNTYSPVTTATGTVMPDANAQFSELLDEGVLMLNYTGHGSTTQWTDEKLLQLADIEQMTNKNLPLWVTATCDFTRYDDKDKSGGELVFLNKNGGGVALVTTSRIVLSDNNFTLNSCFMKNVFERKDGKRLTLGEIMNETKRDNALNNDANKLNFTFIGDPALKLAYPEYSARITQINERDVVGNMDTLNALSRVTVRGKIYKTDGSFADDFNGILIPTVLDASKIIARFDLDAGDTLSINDRSNVLFSGRDSVVNGDFEFTFVVPLDNSYSFEQGRINLYAWQNDGSMEAQGNFDGFILGGTDTSAPSDIQGPEMSLFLNDESFVSGKTVGNRPTFIARLFDENGLNTSGNGVGHDLTLVIDGKPSLTFNLNSIFNSDIGSYQSGYVRFQLPELFEGAHQLQFKAWDVQNNSSLASLDFVVRNAVKPKISDVRFAQRGGVGYFRFEHDRPVVSSTIKLAIYDLTGRLIWTTTQEMDPEENLSEALTWNLSDQNDRRVTNGIYICRILLTDSSGNQQSSSIKISVIGQ